MIVNLRVYDPPEIWWRRLLRRKNGYEKTYTPAIIDPSEIRFAYVDTDGDINFQKKDTGIFYAVEYSDQLFHDINMYVQINCKKITGFVHIPENK